MVQFVRTQADADATDAPEALLAVHARIAYNDILSRRSAWDHLETAETLTTTAGEDVYAYPGTLDTVYGVTYLTGGVLRRLTYMTRQDAELQFGSTLVTGIPTVYTVWNGNIQIFPAPNDVYSLTVRGFTTPTSWPAGAGSVPDLPTALHDAICWYMLSGFYMSQEDAQMAGVYMNEYQQQVDRVLSGEVAKQFAARPLVMGGRNGPRRSFTEHVRGQLEG